MWNFAEILEAWGKAALEQAGLFLKQLPYTLSLSHVTSWWAKKCSMEEQALLQVGICGTYYFKMYLWWPSQVIRLQSVWSSSALRFLSRAQWAQSHTEFEIQQTSTP